MIFSPDRGDATAWTAHVVADGIGYCHLHPVLLNCPAERATGIESVRELLKVVRTSNCGQD
jgi:hypothetical protein